MTSKRSIRILQIILVAFSSGAFVAHTALGDYFANCLRLYDDLKKVPTEMKNSLSATDDWKSLVTHLEQGLSPHDRQPFVIKVKDVDGDAVFSPSANDFNQADFVFAHEPVKPIPEGGRVLRSPIFGYDLPTTFRRIGPLDFIVVDANDIVVEVGIGTEEVKTEFLRHLHGVTLTPTELKRISELNVKLLSDLRKNPEAQRKVLEFANKRHWPQGLAEAGGLAYFDPSVLDLRQWAKTNNYTMAEMIDAGWYRLDFDGFGRARYTLSSPDSIKIPFFGADGKEIPVWRSRNMAKNNPKLPKYISWQMDRSVDRYLTVDEHLYNGAKLRQVKGKTIVITEGEFKCLVTEKLTGIPMFGIPGITEFDDEMLNTLIDAEASEYVIILDRDPPAKALFRAEKISDSERASYAMAKDFERLAANRGKTIKVKVGRLPEMSKGEKLGIDDLVLKYGVDPVHQTVAGAMSADEYAKLIGLNPELEALSRRRGKLNKAIRNREIANNRKGIPKRDDIVKRAEKEVKKINRTIGLYLDNELNDALSMTSAAWDTNSIRPTVLVPQRNGDRIFLRNGRKVEPEKYSEDILLLDYVPSDVDWKDCVPGKCGQVHFSRDDIAATFSGQSPSGTLREALEIGRKIAIETGFEPKSVEDFALIALAGDLTYQFPLDEYYFEFGVRFLNSNEKGDKAVIPITIFKRDSGRAMAFANLHLPNEPGYWTAEEARVRARVAFIRGNRPIDPAQLPSPAKAIKKRFTTPGNPNGVPEQPATRRASGF
jgi:hypothetical protein